MDINSAAVIVVVVIALVGIAAFIRFRQHSTLRMKGPFGTGLEVDASNELPTQPPGIQAKGITSREGGLVVDDLTGRGINVEIVDTKSDVLLSSKNPANNNDPKSNPPA